MACFAGNITFLTNFFTSFELANFINTKLIGYTLICDNIKLKIVKTGSTFGSGGFKTIFTIGITF